MKFDHLRMETMLGAIYSRIEDIQSLIEHSETKRVQGSLWLDPECEETCRRLHRFIENEFLCEGTDPVG